MKTSKLFMMAGCAVALSAMSLTSCSSSDTIESDPTVVTGGKTMTFTVNKGFAEDTLTRASVKPETQRIILADGLLVDATLTDEGNTVGTRATTYETIPDGSTGMAFICANGSTVIKKMDDFTVSNQKIVLTMPSPNTGNYDIYFYLNEDANLKLANATGASVGGDVTNVILANRASGIKDDYAKVTNVSASSTTMNNDGNYLTFTPLGCEVKLTVNAGVTPLSGFNMTMTGVQTSAATNVKVSTGSYTASTTAGSAVAFTNTCYSTVADREYSDALYADKLVCHEGYQAFMSMYPTASHAATLTINSISGPDGTNANNVKSYSSGNTMTFTQTYQNGHRYNLILNLATPINGYAEVNTQTGVATGTVKGDVADQVCNTGIVDTYSPAFKPTYTADATWPCLEGRPQYYEWDARACMPAVTLPQNPSTTFCPYSFFATSYTTQPVTPDPKNPVASSNAKYSCAKCPSYNQIAWYLSAGTYLDYGRWYCPNGFLYNNSTRTDKKEILVHQGGRWLKKYSKITDFSNTTFPTSGVTANADQCYTASVSQTGKPGTVKLKSTDSAHQNPNDWFFLPLAGCDYNGSVWNNEVGTRGLYWANTVNDGASGYQWAWYLELNASGAHLGKYFRYYGMCLWLLQ